jgi:TRAP-type C4-dicarboxylate transport system permease small subunit
MTILIRRVLDQLTAALRVSIVALAIVMLLALTLQVAMRFFFNQALSWSEELALGCFSWVMLLAIAVGVRDAIHVRMDLLVDLLPTPLRRSLDVLVLLSVAGLGVFVAWSGVNYVVDSFGTTSAAIGYPIAFLYASAPAGGALIALYALERALLGPAPAAQPEVE